MKKQLRVFCALLALLLVGVLFSACGTPSATPPTNGTAGSSGTSEVTEEPQPELGFASENNNGAAITILMPQEKDFEIALDAGTDRVSAAMYQRNCAVEDYLGVIFDIKVASGSWANRHNYNKLISNSVMVAKEYDIVTGQTSCTFVPCAQEGLFQDLNALESFDFSAEWWVPNMTENYAIENRLYGVVGDLSLSLYRSMAVLFFNQYLIDQYQLESPYDMVRKGTWTLSNMMEMAKSVEETVDGAYDVTTNMMGFMPYFTVNRNFLCALDVPLVERNAETGAVTVPLNPNEKLIDIFDYMYDAYENCNAIYCSGSLDECMNSFKNNTVLITGGSFNEVERLRDMEKDYGLVPLPKYNEEQANYLSAISQDGLMWHIPVNSSQPELCAKAMEALSFYGLYDVTPEYYEVALGLVYARDENVQEMLRIMRQNAVMRWESIYDMAFTPSMWNIIQMTDAFRHPASNKVGTYHGDNVVTFWATNQVKWQTGVDKLYAALSGLQ